MITIFNGFTDVLIDVTYALLPLLIFFMIFQIFFLRLKWPRVRDILMGFLLTYVGLSLFLQGVNVGFMPIGEMMGEVIGGLSNRYIFIPIGFILGFFAAFAEPALQVQTKQVERISAGAIPRRVLLVTISIGVGLSIMLSIVRIFAGFSIWYLVLPGYLLSFYLASKSSKLFTAIAFDSGGIVTGPMISTFMLSLFVGLAGVTEGRDPLIDGFGMIALVALAPILSVLLLGRIYASGKRGRRSGTD